VKVLLHYPNLDEPPVGIWWLDPETSQPQASYVDGSTEYETRGRQILFQKVSTVSWYEYWAKLEERAPYFSAWASADLDPAAMTPEEFLDLARRVRST
jgi:hypothetical protein